MSRFTSPDQIKTFVLGGNATVTIESEKTGTHYTYRVRKSEDGNATFVSVLAGPNNENDYRYMGLLIGDTMQVKPTRKSSFACESVPVRSINYVLAHVNAGQMPPHAIVRHEGRCGACNRKLTTPESLDRGIGPDCWERLAA